MSFKINVRTCGEVNILELHGRLTLGEPGSILRNSVRSLIDAGSKKLLLNLIDLSYVDSSGLEALMDVFMKAKLAGGVLKMYYPTLNPRQLFKLTKLDSILLTKVDDETHAINEVSEIPERELRCSCPIYGCNGWAPVRTLEETEFRCIICKSEFALSHPPRAEKQVPVKIVRLLNYLQDDIETRVSLLSGPPFMIELVGRLELFSFNFLKKAWLGIQPPRKAIFELSHATHISDKGRQALLDLFSTVGQDKAAILMEGWSRDDIEAFPPGSPIYEDRPAAVASLGDISSMPPWIVEIWSWDQ